ncbi:MAG TPA: hypothetical protein VGH37_19075, partial [Candidatus Acidoferrum sp.]
RVSRRVGLAQLKHHFATFAHRALVKYLRHRARSITGTQASAVTALRLSATALAPVLSTDPARSARSPAVME